MARAIDAVMESKDGEGKDKGESVSYIVSAVLLIVCMETYDVRWCYAAAAFCVAGRIGDWIDAWREKNE